ncbi:MAG: hypothetical protein Q7T82_14745 [Armatimonadota bacterium]|nr:hypothetical protein [Armatimonadota bacterium]
MSLKAAALAATTALGMTIFTLGAACADRRLYLVTYGYYTPVKGEIEIEQWTDGFVERGGGTAYRSRTEIEYGVTDRLAAALYLVNKRPVGGPWNYDETKLQLRYRLTEIGKRFWDTAGYLEIVRPNDSAKPYEMEAKAIFSHEFPKFNLSLNLIAEKELVSGAETEKGYAIGVAPYAKGRVRCSLELFGGEHKHYVMPALWWSKGARNMGIGLAAGLTPDSDRLQVRTLYAVEF